MKPIAVEAEVAAADAAAMARWLDDGGQNWSVAEEQAASHLEELQCPV
jgi:hypothetical protein